MLDESKIDNLAVFVVSSSQLGAKEKHTKNAIQLMSGPQVQHYWDGDLRVGAAIQEQIEVLKDPAWDFWMLYAPGTAWPEDKTPMPDWWEHNLWALGKSRANLLLDPERFAAKARMLASQ